MREEQSLHKRRRTLPFIMKAHCDIENVLSQWKVCNEMCSFLMSMTLLRKSITLPDNFSKLTICQNFFIINIYKGLSVMTSENPGLPPFVSLSFGSLVSTIRTTHFSSSSLSRLPVDHKLSFLFQSFLSVCPFSLFIFLLSTVNGV